MFGKFRARYLALILMVGAIAPVCLVVAVWLRAFSLPPEARLQMVLASKAGCSVPCWLDLQPGVSSMDEVSSFWHISWAQTRMAMLINVFPTGEGKVSYIMFLPNPDPLENPKYDMPLGTIFSALGNPDAYAALDADDGEDIRFYIYISEGLIIGPVFTGNLGGYLPCALNKVTELPAREILLVQPDAPEKMVEIFEMASDDFRFQGCINDDALD